MWNEDGLDVGLVISPPLWGKGWFRLLVVALVLALAGFAHRLRIRHLLGREQELARRVEQGLDQHRKSEERYRLLFERNLAGVVRATIEGRILDCNDAFARILGYGSRRQCLRREGLWTEPGEREEFLVKLREEGQVVSHEHPLRSRDGSAVPLLWNAHLVAEDSGLLVVEGTVADISQRRRMEEGLLRTQKLESLAVLAGGIAHDFNNLLTAILGQAELVQSELPATSPARQRLAQIEQAVECAASLSKQMLAYSGKGSLAVEPTDVSGVVENLAGLLEGAISESIVLRYRLDRELPAAEADVNQLGQVVLSLVTNASEAIGDGAGTVVVATGRKHCDREYLAGTFLDEQLVEGEYVFIEVNDDGCGMDEETQRKVFDPFFTTKFTDRGLVLAAVLGIVRGHQGAIEIDSEAGSGTTVRVLLPVSERGAEEPAEMPGSEEVWRGFGPCCWSMTKSRCDWSVPRWRRSWASTC